MSNVKVNGFVNSIEHLSRSLRVAFEIQAHTWGLRPLARKDDRYHRTNLTRGYLSVTMIETFDNPAPGRDYVIIHTCPEFTSVCPKTGQPDFATIELEYIPDHLCIELKSLKLYYYSFRNQGIFYEGVVNKLLDDLVESCQPRYMKVTGEFNIRGGISSTIEAEYDCREQ